MTTFACRSCGSTDSFQEFEMAPRHRDIRIEANTTGRPEAIEDPSGNDEVFYEASEFRAYRCDACGAEKTTLAELVTAQ